MVRTTYVYENLHNRENNELDYHHLPLQLVLKLEVVLLILEHELEPALVMFIFIVLVRVLVLVMLILIQLVGTVLCEHPSLAMVHHR